MADLDEFLQEIRSEGRPDSSGQFALDIKKAAEKLAHFFAPGGRDFLHYWIRFAVYFEAPEISLDETSHEVCLEFSGRGPEAEQVRGIFTQADRGLRYLQMGIIGALHQGYARVELETPVLHAVFLTHDQSLVTTSLLRGQCRLRATKPGTARKRWVHWGRTKCFPIDDFPLLDRPASGQPRKLSAWPPKRERGILLCASPLYSRRLNHRHPLETPELGALRCLWIPHGAPPSPARLTLLVQGAHFETACEANRFPPGTWALVEAPDAKLDLSLRKLVTPPLPPGRLAELQPPLARCLSRLLLAEPPLLERISLEMADWLVDHLFYFDNLEGARQLLEALIARFCDDANTTEPLKAALLERGAALDPKWKAPAEKAWRSVWDSEEAVHNWRSLVESGCVRCLHHPWIANCLCRLPVRRALKLYREVTRRPIFEPADSQGPCASLLEPGLAQEFVEYGSDSLLRNYLLAGHFLASGTSQIPSPAAVYCGQLLMAAIKGEETVPDLPDLDLRLTATDKHNIAVLVGAMCRHVLDVWHPQPHDFDLRLLLAETDLYLERTENARTQLRSLAGAAKLMLRNQSAEDRLQRLQYICSQAGIQWGSTASFREPRSR